jgi:cytochrome oxidase Cu insertion factor (SCO1/SenC/PrrC family)
MTRRVVLACALVLTVIVARAQTPAPTPLNLDRIGPAVGVSAPAFTLPDASGAPRSLQSLLGPKGALLVFSRSADW